MSFLLEPFFSSFTSLFTAFNHGVNGSVCLKWYDISLSFLVNLLKIISLALSHIIAGGTSFHEKRRETSWASLFSYIGNTHDQPKLVAKICVQMLPFLDTVAANNTSLYTLCSNLLYHNWWWFVLNCLDMDICNTVWTTCCVVHCIILSASLGEIPHFSARTKWSSHDTFSI